MVAALIALFLLAVLIFFINQKDILSPTFITVAIYFVGFVFANIGIGDWTYIKYNSVTTLVIFCAILCMECGEYFVRNSWEMNDTNGLKSKLLSKSNAPKNVSNLIEIPLILECIGLIVSCVAFYLYYQRMIEIAYEYGYSGKNLLLYIRKGLLTGEERTGYIIVILKNFAQAFCFVNIFCFSNNLVQLQKKRKIIKYIIYLFSLIPVVLIYYISSSRYAFIKLAVYIVGCLLFAYFKSGKKLTISLVVKVLGVIALFFVAFVWVYKVMGEDRASVTDDTLFDKFVLYAGSSIAGLSEYIRQGMPSSTYFGEETLCGIFGLIRRFFPDFVSGTYFLPHFFLNEVLETNIYTMIRSLIADYGIFGMLAIELWIGLIFTFAYKIALKSKFFTISIIYLYFIPELIYQLFAPLLFTDIGSITQIFELLWIFIICFCIQKSQKKK